MTTKTCTKCKEEKGLEEFSRHKTGKHGRQTQCKICSRIRDAQYYQKNRDKIKSRSSRYRADNSEYCAKYSRKYWDTNKESLKSSNVERYYRNRERYLEQQKKYYWGNVDLMRERKRQDYLNNKDKRRLSIDRYYRENIDRLRRYKRLWYEENKDKVVASRLRRKTLKRRLFHHNVPDTYLISRDALFCGWCSKPLPTTLESVHRDHIIPLSLNGPHTHWNLTLTCAPCNLSKGAKHPLNYVKTPGLKPSVHVLRILDYLHLAQEPVMMP